MKFPPDLCNSCDVRGVGALELKEAGCGATPLARRSPSAPSSSSSPRSEPRSPRSPRSSARSPRCARSPGAQRRAKSCPGARPLQPSHTLCRPTDQPGHSPPSLARAPLFPSGRSAAAHSRSSCTPPSGAAPSRPSSHFPPSSASSASRHRSSFGPARSRDRRPLTVRPPRSLASSVSRSGLTNDTGEVFGVLLLTLSTPTPTLLSSTPSPNHILAPTLPNETPAPNPNQTMTPTPTLTQPPCVGFGSSDANQELAPRHATHACDMRGEVLPDDGVSAGTASLPALTSAPAPASASTAPAEEQQPSSSLPAWSVAQHGQSAPNDQRPVCGHPEATPTCPGGYRPSRL